MYPTMAATVAPSTKVVFKGCLSSKLLGSGSTDMGAPPITPLIRRYHALRKKECARLALAAWSIKFVFALAAHHQNLLVLH